jgi:hypothetical protein
VKATGTRVVAATRTTNGDQDRIPFSPRGVGYGPRPCFTTPALFTAHVMASSLKPNRITRLRIREPRPSLMNNKFVFFSKIENRDYALSIVKSASSVLFALALLQAGVAVHSVVFEPTKYFSTDPTSVSVAAVSFAALAFALLRYNSRAVSLMLLVSGSTLLVVAFYAPHGLVQSALSITVAVVIIVAALRALQATIALHGRLSVASRLTAAARTVSTTQLSKQSHDERATNTFENSVGQSLNPQQAASCGICACDFEHQETHRTKPQAE